MLMMPVEAPAGISCREKIRFSRQPPVSQIFFHNGAFSAWFIAALSAGDDEDGVRMIGCVFQCFVKAERQCPAWTFRTYMGTQDDDVILRL